MHFKGKLNALVGNKFSRLLPVRNSNLVPPNVLVLWDGFDEEDKLPTPGKHTLVGFLKAAHLIETWHLQVTLLRVDWS
jgi:hypothetical protein